MMNTQQQMNKSMKTTIKINSTSFTSLPDLTGITTFTDLPDLKGIATGTNYSQLSKWEIDFWNNNNEFPNDNSKRSNLRSPVFELIKRWFKINSSQKKFTSP